MSPESDFVVLCKFRWGMLSGVKHAFAWETGGNVARNSGQDGSLRYVAQARSVGDRGFGSISPFSE